MNERKIIRLLRLYKPTTAQEVLDHCKFPLQYVGSGQFRDVYHIVGSTVVIKIPRYSQDERRRVDYKKNLRHARDEHSMWKRIKRSKVKFAEFHKYLPDILHFSASTGVIAMRQYSVPAKKVFGSLLAQLDHDLARIMGVVTADVHSKNVGFDGLGRPKLLDLGYMIRGRS